MVKAIIFSVKLSREEGSRLTSASTIGTASVGSKPLTEMRLLPQPSHSSAQQQSLGERTRFLGAKVPSEAPCSPV